MARTTQATSIVSQTQRSWWVIFKCRRKCDCLRKIAPASRFLKCKHKAPSLLECALQPLKCYRDKIPIIPLLVSARTDRYNHELETDDDEEDDEEFSSFSNEFSNFSTCSPRYSRICGSPVPSPVTSPGPSSPVSPNNPKKASDAKDSGEEVSTPRSDLSSESSPPTVRKRSLERNPPLNVDSRDNDEDFQRQRSDSGVDSDRPRSRTNSTNK